MGKLLFLLSLLAGCATTVETPPLESPIYKAGDCAAWDVEAVEETGQTCDPNTEISIWGFNKSTNIKLDDTYSIRYIIRDSGVRVTTRMGVNKFDSLTYPVVCGSCCPPGKVCIQGCEEKNE